MQCEQVPTPRADTAQADWVWHPALRAIAWLVRWAGWAVLLSVVVQGASTGGLQTLRIGEVFARAVLIWLSVGAGWLLLDLGQKCVRGYARLRRGGMGAFAAALGAYGVLALITLPAAWMGWWVLRLVDRNLDAIRSLGLLPPLRVPAPDHWVQGLAVLATGFAVALLVLMTWGAWRSYRRVVQALGWGYLAKGHLLMAVMRWRQNRRDFFVQAPPVGNVQALVFAVFAHELARGTAVSDFLPALIVLLSMARTTGELTPPFWLLLGRSTFDTYHLFTALSMAWSVPGVNLLDRSKDEWQRYYRHWSEAWIRSGVPLARAVLNRPGVQRDWSLRPRGDLWMPSAWNLMGFVPAIVIDARSASRHVDDEILWAVEMNLLDKVWLVAADDGSAPALRSAFEWAAADGVKLPLGSFEALSARVVTKDQLAQAGWSRGRLVVALAAMADESALSG